MRTFLSSLFFSFFFFLPKKTLSWVFTRLLHLPLPLGLAKLSIKGFARFYKISLSEMEKPLENYTCIGEFFSRKLLPNLRPIALEPCVHPVDATLLRVQIITKEELYQAKGQTYRLGQLLGEKKKKQKGYAQKDSVPKNSIQKNNVGNVQESQREILSFWEGGLAFTYYLCPRDYHRIHCPFDAKVIKVVRLKGTLWPVHAWARDHVSQLFCRNERVLVFLESTENPHFQGVLVCIGALNVGSIVLAFDAKKSSLPLVLKKGTEVAAFHMGSSVVFLCNAQLRKQFLSTFKEEEESLLKTLPEKQVYMGKALLLH